MKKSDLVDLLRTRNQVTKIEAEGIVNAMFDSITDALANGDDVTIAGFGKFIVKDVAARKGINPLTKESIDIPASKKVTFKPEKSLKEAVKGN